MAEGHGGYRRPSNPAPVSGPGRLSQRTDGGPGQAKAQLSNARYGEQAEYQSIQSGAPMSKAAPLPAATSGGGAGLPSVTPLGAPTERPDEPVTAGAAAGAGVGPEALGLPTGQRNTAEDLTVLRKYLPTFIDRANAPDSTASFRNWVRQLRAELAE